MDKMNSTMGLVRTKSDQLVETVAAAMAAMKSSPSGEGTTGTTPTVDGSRKSSRRITSPGGANSSSRHYNTHIRKTRSAQLKLDIDDLSNGAALSRASSASLGLSFSFTGFNVPPEDIVDSKPFSDDDIRKFFFFLCFGYSYNMVFAQLLLFLVHLYSRNSNITLIYNKESSL